jgi:hypothetical protein
MLSNVRPLKRAVFGSIFVLIFQATLLLAVLPYDDEGDCDVDGVDLHYFISSQGNDIAANLSSFAGLFGTLQSECDRIGIGTPINGHPNWHERTLMVFTNLARMAPVAYRDSFMRDFVFPPDGILNDGFPAVPPLYSVHQLNRSARFHALDMALSCQNLQHDSCDGTPWFERIRTFYPEAEYIGENVAYTSNVDTPAPWYIVSLFLCEPTGGVCAGDEEPFSVIGHRENIMSVVYSEIGCGYGQGADAYWVQDFNGVELPPQPPVAAATHAMINAGNTTFFVNYYDAAGVPPQEIKVILEGDANSLNLGWGDAGAGTYQLTLPAADGCRAYYFHVTDADGHRYRYPGSGSFQTYGEGGCSLDFMADDGLLLR